MFRVVEPLPRKSSFWLINLCSETEIIYFTINLKPVSTNQSHQCLKPKPASVTTSRHRPNCSSCQH